MANDKKPRKELSGVTTEAIRVPPDHEVIAQGEQIQGDIIAAAEDFRAEAGAENPDLAVEADRAAVGSKQRIEAIIVEPKTNEQLEFDYSAAESWDEL